MIKNNIINSKSYEELTIADDFTSDEIVNNMVDAKIRRNYKDSVFRMLFSKPEDLLSLYNAVNGTNYTNVEDLEINTLDNAVYMNMKNDVSFIFEFSLNLYEHQSTNNPNMPLRDLFYVATLYEKMIQTKTLYSSRPISIPMPIFIVFYNGVDKDMDEVSEYKLSDLYMRPKAYKDKISGKNEIGSNVSSINEEFPLELKVKVLNINAEMNYTMKKNSERLMGYCIYVDKVREYAKVLTLNDAVDKALAYCIDNNILRDFFTSQRAEVKHMSILEFKGEEEWIKVRNEEREYGRELGMEEGREIGLAEGRAEIIAKMLKSGMTSEEVSLIVDMSTKEVQSFADKE